MVQVDTVRVVARHLHRQGGDESRLLQARANLREARSEGPAHRHGPHRRQDQGSERSARRAQEQALRREDDDERKKLDEQIASIEDEIYNLGKKLDDMQHRIDEERHQIDARVENGERCVEAREAVQRAFADAKSSARSESDDQIKPLAEQLVRYWESEEPTHEQELKTVKDVRDHCKDLR